LPFVGLALLTVVLVSPIRRDIRGVGLASLVGFLALLPELVYNAVRTGSPFVASTGKQFESGGIGGNFVEGFSGLLAAPNRGLFVFAPVLLLAVAVPFAWSRLDAPWRRLVVIFGMASVLYLALLANLRGWGTFGWGPRYLVPVLPFFFLLAVLAGEAQWVRRRRVVIGLGAVSAILTLGPVLVNWNATSDNAVAIVSQDTLWPRQQYEVWRGLARAAQGKNVDADVRLNGLPDAKAAVFPDVWLIQLADRSTTGALAALVLFIALVVGGLGVGRYFVCHSARAHARPA
jgi:hypothetical protein